MPARELFSSTDGQNLFVCGVSGDNSENFDSTSDKIKYLIYPLKEEVKFFVAEVLVILQGITPSNIRHRWVCGLISNAKFQRH